MTVDHATGEIAETLTEVEARRLTERIRLLADDLADKLDKMAKLIDEARVGSAWLALGYSSWTAYVSEEFAGVLPRLDREPRREFVRELEATGMSSRSIAPILGVSDRQVRRDMNSGGTDVPPGPNPNAQAEAQARIDAREDQARQRAYQGLDDLVADCSRPAPAEPEPVRPNVVGLDGKTYTRPEPKPQPVVLTDSAADYDNAEKASKSLSNAIAKLLEFQHPNMREAMRRYWSMASKEVPPTPRRDVTPEQMREAAHGLLALADEWSMS